MGTVDFDVFDADNHYYEAPDAFTRHIEPQFARRGMQWVTVDGKQEVGPFVTLEEARADRHAADEYAPEPGESLQEAESELGIAEWIDPETGDPAEGQSRPHFESE